MEWDKDRVGWHGAWLGVWQDRVGLGWRDGECVTPVRAAGWRRLLLPKRPPGEAGGCGVRGLRLKSLPKAFGAIRCLVGDALEAVCEICAPVDKVVGCMGQWWARTPHKWSMLNQRASLKRTILALPSHGARVGEPFPRHHIRFHPIA